MSIDEVSLSQGELYTFVNNKAGKGKKGTIVASTKGTRSTDIFKVLEKIPLKKRNQVKEISGFYPNPTNSETQLSYRLTQVSD